MRGAPLEIVYHLLVRNEPYREMGVEYLAVRDQKSMQRRLVKPLAYEVAPQPRASGAAGPSRARAAWPAILAAVQNERTASPLSKYSNVTYEVFRAARQAWIFKERHNFS